MAMKIRAGRAKVKEKADKKKSLDKNKHEMKKRLVNRLIQYQREADNASDSISGGAGKSISCTGQKRLFYNAHPHFCYLLLWLF